MELSLFPLNAVLAPGVAMPLHIFEPRYRAMIGRCIDERRPFGVVLIRRGSEVGRPAATLAEAGALAEVGTIAEIREVRRMSDGRMDIVTMGTERFRLLSARAAPEGYLVGDVAILDEPPGSADALVTLASRVRGRFVRYLELLADDVGIGGDVAGPDAPGDVGADAGEALDDALARATGGASVKIGSIRVFLPGDPTRLAHLIAGLVEVDLPTRQELLEAVTTEARLVALDAILRDEVAMLRLRLGPYAPDPRLGAALRN